MTVRAVLRRCWRTVLGAVVGGAAGALYAHYVGCRTGTCAITSNAWTAALFFGFTGVVVMLPGKPAASAQKRGGAPQG